MTKKIIKTVVVLALLIIAFFFAKEYVNRGVAISQLSTSLRFTTDSAKKFKDLYGITHNILEATTINSRVAAQLKDSTIADQARRLKIKPNQITSHLSFNASKEGYVKINVDSLVKAIKKDKLPGDTTHDYAYIPYREDIDLKINQYWKRKWFAGNKKKYIDIYSLDNNVEVYNFKQMYVGDEYGPFAVSFFAGFGLVNMRPVEFGGVAGIGLSYTPNFMRFKKRK